MKKAFILILLVTIPFLTQAQTVRELYAKSIEAYKAKDYKEFRRLNKEALELHPSQPTILFNLAVSESLNNNNSEAFALLKKLLSWKSNLQYQDEKDLNNFLENSEYKEALENALESMNKSIVSSKNFMTLPKSIHIEDFEIIKDKIIASDVYNGTLNIYNIKDAKHHSIDLAASALAVTKAKEKNCVWVSTTMLPNYKNFSKEEENKSIIYKVDIKKRKVISTIEIPEKSVIGSMVLNNDGMLYATSSASPTLHVIDTKKSTIQKIVKLNEAFNLQGITIDKEKQALYVADYIKGIGKIEIDNLENRKWITSTDFLLKGLDGLTFIRNNELIAIQNSSTPRRVIKISLNGNVVKNVSFLDNALPVKGEPTNGKYYKNKGFFYIINSQWPFYDKESKPLKDKWEQQKINIIPVD